MAELDATPSLSVHIRDRHLRDIPDLVRMLREGFPGWYRRLPYLLFPTIVAEHDGRAVGFVSMPMRNRVGEIGLIAVDAPARGYGIGKALLHSALEVMQTRGMVRCVAKVRLDNPPAQRLFADQGFSIVRTKRRRWLGDVYWVEREL